jgi:tellurite resistance protein TehA-like permease
MILLYGKLLLFFLICILLLSLHFHLLQIFEKEAEHKLWTFTFTIFIAAGNQSDKKLHKFNIIAYSLWLDTRRSFL